MEKDQDFVSGFLYQCIGTTMVWLVLRLWHRISPSEGKKATVHTQGEYEGALENSLNTLLSNLSLSRGKEALFKRDGACPTYLHERREWLPW